MLKNIYDFLKNNAGIEMFMAVVLLVAVTAIACNMEKITEKENPKTTQNKSGKNAALQGKTVVIDPGHGGSDPGKVGVSGKLEKDLNLQIAFQLRDTLSAQGCEVILTREEDRHLGEGEKFRKTADLNARCSVITEAAEKNPDAVMISIHQNSFESPKVKGAQCFYYHNSEKGRALAEAVQQQLNAKINVERAKKTKSNQNYYMLINSDCPGIIIECGFLSNPKEEADLSDETYQKRMAETIAEGIKAYYGE